MNDPGPNVAVRALASLGVAAGVVAAVAGIREQSAPLLLASLASAWLFFAGLAAGGLALSAAVRVAQGRWASSLLPAAERAGGFFLPAWILLAVLVAGAGRWIPWAVERSLPPVSLLSLKELVATALLFLVGYAYLRAVRTGRGVQRFGVAYLLAYVAVLSVWDVDFVIHLSSWAPSTVLPAMYFMGCFLTALAWSILATPKERFSPDERHDAGKLLFALVVFWSYLLWSAYLPTWYGNVPEETGQLMARWTPGFRPWTLFLLIGGILIPFVLLVSETAKRNRVTLSIGALLVLAALGADRFLLVFPSLSLAPTHRAMLLGAGIAAGVAGLFTLSLSRVTRSR